MLVRATLLASLVTIDAKPIWVGNVIGAAVPSSFDRYWNQVTPENAGKWGTVEAQQGVFTWGNLDLVYAHATNMSFAIKDHNLVWGSQYPTWLSSLSTADQTSAIQNWIAQVGKRYASRTNFIDVVNEPIHTPYPFQNALGGNGTTGWDWIITAFKLARTSFPNTKLLINEYGIVNDSNARKTYLHIIKLLKDRGLIDGVGAQAHYFNVDGMSAAGMKAALDDLATSGLPLYIAELDITGGNGKTEADQLAKYQELFPVMYDHPSVKGVTLWGYIEGQTWAAHTGIINLDGTERLAMKWLVQQGFVKHDPTSPPSHKPVPRYQPQTTGSGRVKTPCLSPAICP